MKRRRILHVIDSLDLGGAQEVIRNLIAYGDAERFSWEVATMHGRGVYWPRIEQLGVPLHSLSPHKFLPLYLPRLIRLCAGKFDAIHCHLIAANLLAKPLARLSGVRVLFNHDHTNDDYRMRNLFRRNLDAFSNNFSTHIFAVSQSIQTFLVNQEHVTPEKISLIYNGVDSRRFQPATGKSRAGAREKFCLPPEAFVIGGIGRLNRQKHFSMFLDVAAQVSQNRPDTLWIIAGTGPEEKALRQLARESGLAGRVRFAGFIEQPEKFYPALDVLLMPSLFEGTPMTMLEAMATGVPLVASRLDGIAEIARDGEHALLAGPHDRDRFADHIEALIESPNRRTQLAAAAQALVREKFTAEKMTRQVEAIYAQYFAM